jgi:hypothetical protein
MKHCADGSTDTKGPMLLSESQRKIPGRAPIAEANPGQCVKVSLKLSAHSGRNRIIALTGLAPKYKRPALPAFLLPAWAG